jgi:ParB family chromosome partitioning protein
VNVPLLIELRDMTDREAIIAMDIENRQRSDISAYERGLSYVRWLRGGYFGSQDDIARALRISQSRVSRLLKVAQLPSVILEAFGNPTDIREGWGIEIMQGLEEPVRRQKIIRAARSIIAAPRPDAREVYRQLMRAAAEGRSVKRQIHDEVVKDPQGRPLFRIRQHMSSIAFCVPSRAVAPDLIDQMRGALRKILQHAPTLVRDGEVPQRMSVKRQAGIPFANRETPATWNAPRRSVAEG